MHSQLLLDHLEQNLTFDTDNTHTLTSWVEGTSLLTDFAPSIRLRGTGRKSSCNSPRFPAASRANCQKWKEMIQFERICQGVSISESEKHQGTLLPRWHPKTFPLFPTTVTPLPHGVAEEEGVLLVVAARKLGPVNAAIRWVVDAVGGVGHRGELGRDALARQSVKAHVHL